jgi:transcription-repair coupling factor (superfamily II helicase)
VELRESQQLRLARLYPGSLVKPAVRSILVPKPSTARVGGQPLRDLEMLTWCRELVDAVLIEGAPAARATTTDQSEAKGT